MNNKHIISITEARKRLFQIADDVQVPDTHYILTENGRPKVVLMSIDEFDSWTETMEVMKDFPNLDKDIAEVERDIKSGAYKQYVTLEDMMLEHGFVLADKSKNKYEVANKTKKKSRKRA